MNQGKHRRVIATVDVFTGQANSTLVPYWCFDVRYDGTHPLEAIFHVGLMFPSKSFSHGFVDLEPHGIVQAVSNTLVSLDDSPLERFNQSPAPLFQGRTFVELDQDERVDFLNREIAEESGDPAVKRVYKLVRIAVLNVFYSNFPEHKVARDADGIPILKPGDRHQITNPNTDQLVTGWDVAGYRGPLSWEQEEQMRTNMQKVHWHDDLEDLVVRYRPKNG